MTTLIHAWSREFSRQGVLSMAITFSDLMHESSKYKHRIVRPLYVILLTTKETLDEFTNTVQYVDVTFPVWFVIFMPYPGSPLKAFCSNPTENRFNVNFKTEMIVMCYDIPVLREWYAMSDNRTKVFDVATWERGKGFTSSSDTSLYARRSNLHGESIRIAIVKDAPFIKFWNGTATGYFGAILLELSKAMNFNPVILSPAETYGSWNDEAHMWTGVIGQLVTNRADVGVSGFTVTPHRLEVVDFTLPLILSRNRLYIRKLNNSDVQWTSYFKTFQFEIWMLILSVIMTAPILLTLIKTRGYIAANVMFDTYIQVWGIYCQQGLAEFPSEFSTRLAFFSIFVSALVISAAYSAALISFLTVTTTSLPFTTLEGFVRDGTFKLITLRSSSDYDTFINAKNPLFIQMSALMKVKRKLPLGMFEGFEQVCSEKVVFYVTETVKNALGPSLPCQVDFIDTGRVDNLAMALPKDSPYTGLINYHLQRFHDNGILDRLREKYLLRINHIETVHDAVGLWGIAPILAVFAAGVLLAVFILGLENSYYQLVCKSKLEKKSTIFFHQMLKMRKRKTVKFDDQYKTNYIKPLNGYWP